MGELSGSILIPFVLAEDDAAVGKLLSLYKEDGRSHMVQTPDFVQEPELKKLLGLLKKPSAQYKP